MSLKYWKKVLEIQAQKMLVYKIDFFMGVIAITIEQLVVLLFFTLLFSLLPEILNWSRSEILLIYGFLIASRGIDYTFFDNFWVLGTEYIIKGKLDQLLIRPANTLLLFLAEKINFLGIVNYLLGMSIILGALVSLQFTINVFLLTYLVLITVMGGLIYGGVSFILASFSFWTMDATKLMQLTFELNEIAKYPLTIFPRLIQVTMIVIPYAFIGYFPANFLLQQDPYDKAVLLMPLVIVVVWSCGYLMWKKGLASYVGSTT